VHVAKVTVEDRLTFLQLVMAVAATTDFIRRAISAEDHVNAGSQNPVAGGGAMSAMLGQLFRKAG
jgi:hypothetical protein